MNQHVIQPSYPSLPLDSIVEGEAVVLARQECIQLLTETARSSASGHFPYAVFWLDIDRFERFNTSLGHQAGDRVLALIKHRISQISGELGQVARMGDDEFLLVLPKCDRTLAEQIATHLLAAISQPLQISNLRIRPTVSIGVVTSKGFTDPINLLEQSDYAMHEAKRLGGAQYVVATDLHQMLSDSPHFLREELSIEETLHSALESGELHLEYQPIIRIADGTIETVEALMRCQVGNQIIPPARFIPVAERSGLIIRLGEWTLMSAAQFLTRMHQAGRAMNVSVNVSRAQLLAPKFFQTLHAAVLLNNVLPDWLELEITESLFMDQSYIVQENLCNIMASGFKLAIDDFGTGYSCLAALKDLPAHKLKLDRVFIRDIPNDKRSAAVVKAVVQMALDLDMIVVAEGVETLAQYDALCEVGVSAIQGFYLAEPMDEKKLLSWPFPKAFA